MSVGAPSDRGDAMRLKDALDSMTKRAQRAEADVAILKARIRVLERQVTEAKAPRGWRSGW